VSQAGPSTRSATLTEAVKAGEVALLATPWPAAQGALTGLGDLAGKVLMDATNPLLPDLTGLTLGTTSSAGEQVAIWARGAKVVKALQPGRGARDPYQIVKKIACQRPA
jgi:predicted dinucleotide-binding enzyme